MIILSVFDLVDGFVVECFRLNVDLNICIWVGLSNVIVILFVVGFIVCLFFGLCVECFLLYFFFVSVFFLVVVLLVVGGWVCICLGW